jgi:hypothetical protein
MVAFGRNDFQPSSLLLSLEPLNHRFVSSEDEYMMVDVDDRCVSGDNNDVRLG